MNFNFFQYLKDYRSEEKIEEIQEILTAKWKKTAAIIREAYKADLTDKIEAERIIKDELIECNKIDRKFLVENMDYVIGKFHTISEGDIKIIINNGDKTKGTKSSEVEFETESTKVKRGPGRPKVIDEKKKDKEEEIIVDEPSEENIDDLTVIDEPKEVVIKVIKGETEEDKTTIEVIENEEVIDTLPVDETSVDAIIDFLETFYKEHDYSITIDKGEEEAKEETKEEPEEIEPELKDEEPAEEDMGSLVKESESFLKWNDLFKEDEMDFDYDDTMVSDQDMIGKIAYLRGSSDAVTIVDYDKDLDEVSYVTNGGVEGRCKLSDVVDMESGDEPVEEMTEENMDDAEISEEPPKTENESEIADGTILDEAQKKMAWLKKKSNGSKGKGSSGIKIQKKTASTGSYTKSSNMKPKEKLDGVKIPKSTGKSAPSGSYTAKSGMKPPMTKEDVKSGEKVKSKTPPSGSYSASPMKVSEKKEDVKKVSSKTIPGKVGSYTKNSNMKPKLNVAQSSPKKVASKVGM